MMSITPKITSISSLNCVIKTLPNVSNKKKPILKIKLYHSSNKSSVDIKPSTITISYIEILSLLTFLCHHIHSRSLISDLQSKTQILKRDKITMSDLLSICLMKLLMTIFTALKVISGQ